jgi:signal transduction histidine kinase
MTLQAKLTLGTVLLVTIVVALISAVDLVDIMQNEFEHTLQRANVVQLVATDDVKQALNRPQALPFPGALQTPELFDRLRSVMASSPEIVEVAVVNQDGKILADSFADRQGEACPSYPDLAPLVNQAGWFDKLRVLLGRDATNLQVEKALGPPPLFVRVIVAPALIRDAIKPALNQSADIALTSVIGAICVTFLFSAFAFRPLGRLRRQLDLLASGDYATPEPATGSPANDEVSIMASKVSLLGERLRGAQFEVSDLRGNMDRLLRDLEDAVLIFNRERRLVFASGSVDKFLGRDRSTLSAQSIAEIFPPSTNLGLLIDEAASTGVHISNRRIPLTAAPESASVLLSVDLLEAQPGAANPRSGLIVRLRDPEAQRQIGRQLQTADRLAAISRVSGGVAHEVKNPLNAILLHVEVARSKLARGDSAVDPQMEIISREILRLDRVVKTFLDFTRPVELKLRRVLLQQILGEIADLARPQAAAANIRVLATPQASAADDVEVSVDSDLFKQAVLNVVVNAIQAMPEGGELRFEASASKDTAEIRISDTGPGIPPDLKEKIFRLYFTTKPGGSGIGLAMTFRIVQLHDGTIDFSSEPGKGTAFVIRLPLAV